MGKRDFTLPMPMASTEPAASRLGMNAAELPITPQAGLLGNLSQQKNRGRTRDVAAGDPQWRDIINTHGDDQLGSVVSVSIAVIQQAAVQSRAGVPIATSPLNRIPIVGLASWGTDGGQAECEFDVVNGTLIELPASKLIVSVRVDPQFVGPEGEPLIEGTDLGAQVSGSLGYFPAARGAAQRTLMLNVGVGLSEQVPVPAFARRLRVIRPIPGMAITITYVAAGTGVASFDTVEPMLELPIPNWADSVRVESATTGIISCLFELWI